MLSEKKLKIAITGHTSGIGLSLYNRFKDLGHEVIGFSRSTGHDISIPDVCYSLLDTLNDFDVFVNNAYDPVGQNRLLSGILNNWNGTEKSVINISSNIVSVPYSYFDKFQPVQEYRTSKIVNNDIVNSYKGTVRVLNVLPEGVKTNFYLGKLNPDFIANGMDPNYVTGIIMYEFNNNNFKTIVIKNPGMAV